MRLGIVGVGQITLQAHLPAALASRDCTVTALVDPALDRARAAARAAGLAARVAEDVRDVLDAVDAVLIATPNHTHAPIAVACLEAGKSVLIEKPLAHTSADAAQIVAAARAEDAVLAVGFCTRFRPEIALLHAVLADGSYGRVRRFAHRAGALGGWTPLSGYHLDRKHAGGGVLVVTGAHFLDRMLAIWGVPETIAYADDAEGGPEANARVTVRYEDLGIDGVVVLSKEVPMPVVTVVETETGNLVVEDRRRSLVFRPHATPDRELVIRAREGRAADTDMFVAQLEDFAAAHRRERAPMVDGAHGLLGVEFVESLYARRTSLTRDWYTSAHAEARS